MRLTFTESGLTFRKNLLSFNRLGNDSILNFSNRKSNYQTNLNFYKHFGISN